MVAGGRPQSTALFSSLCVKGIHYEYDFTAVDVDLDLPGNPPIWVLFWSGFNAHFDPSDYVFPCLLAWFVIFSRELGMMYQVLGTEAHGPKSSLKCEDSCQSGYTLVCVQCLLGILVPEASNSSVVLSSCPCGSLVWVSL